MMSDIMKMLVKVVLMPSSYTLLKSDVTTRDHMVRCRGSQECGSRNVNFIGDRTEFA